MIPSIAQRCNRPCNECVWLDCEYDCQASIRLGYSMPGERTTQLVGTVSIKPLPCRFNMTRDELRQILDPYFME